MRAARAAFVAALLLSLLSAPAKADWPAEARGAGPHERHFDDLGDLAPGLHLARLGQGADSRTTRFVRVR